jgi:LysR family glycine cleavage system transcriptional activator
LHALAAFEAATRLGSLSRAAEELAITQSAVSHRVAALETWAGRKLLVRLARGVEPTADGARMLESVATALSVLKDGATQMRVSPQRALVRVSALPSLASYWLVPRLDAFRRSNPDIEFDVRVSWRLARVDQGEVDVALRSGAKSSLNVDAVKVLDDWYYPVCSPQYRKAHGGLRDPVDLASVTLLRHSRESWSSWFQAAGLGPIKLASAPIYSDAGLLLQAAAAHQGVALARHTVAHYFLQRGELVRLFTATVKAPHAYWAVTRKERPSNKAVGTFIDWLLNEARSFPRPE